MIVFSKLSRRAALVYSIVDGWFQPWCTDISWVWRITNPNAAALLHNILHDQLLHRGPQVLHQGSRLLFLNLCCPELLHRIPAVLFFPELHYQRVDYYTDAPKYYTTKAIVAPILYTKVP
jgi:hypothetical protein